MDLNAPQTQALWEKLCCSNQSWYRTAEDMKHHAASLEEENTKLRELFPKILNALSNGSGCTPEVSLEFLQGIPKEVELVIKNLKNERLERALKEAWYIMDTIEGNDAVDKWQNKYSKYLESDYTSCSDCDAHKL